MPQGDTMASMARMSSGSYAGTPTARAHSRSDDSMARPAGRTDSAVGASAAAARTSPLLLGPLPGEPPLQPLHSHDCW